MEGGSGGGWKCCICILICPQSGIVFGVAVKLPGVCSVVYERQARKFKSASLHVLLKNIFNLYLIFLSLILCNFLHRSFKCIYIYIYFLHSVRVMGLFYFIPNSPTIHCLWSDCTDFINDSPRGTVCCSAPRDANSRGPATSLWPHHLHPLSCCSSLISAAHLPSIAL